MGNNSRFFKITAAVSNTLPPSYDEATKQTNETNGHQTGTSTTQDENKF